MKKCFVAKLLAAAMLAQTIGMPVDAAGNAAPASIEEAETSYQEADSGDVSGGTQQEAGDTETEIGEAAGDGGEVSEAAEEKPEGTEEEAESAQDISGDTDGEGEASGNVQDISGNAAEAVEEVLEDVSGNEELSADTEEMSASAYVELFQEGSFTAYEEMPEARSYADSENRKNAMEALYQGLSAKADSIGDLAAYGIVESEISGVYAGVINEHPDLYYVTGGFSYYRNTSSGIVTKISPVYSETEFDDAAFKAAAADIIAMAEGLEPIEQAIAVHDYIVLTCEYDVNYNNEAAKPNNYNAYGTLVDGYAVCQGYALAYKYILNQLGINCYFVTSDEMNHAWNMVELNGECYQVDATWDDPLYNMIGRVYHNYLFCSDETFQDSSHNHYDWVVTYEGLEVECTAEDSSLESKPYLDSVTQIVMDGDYYYYIDSTGIEKYYSPDETESLLYGFSSNGIRWTVWNNSSSYWPGAYSGLSSVDGMLWFNTPKEIRSIALDGTALETIYTPDTSEGYIYGTVSCDGELRYMLRQSPSDKTLEYTTLYPITYHWNGGTEDAGLPSEYYTGQEIDFQTVNSNRDGYEFAGWYQDEELSVPFSYTDSTEGSLELWAEWEPVSYTITYRNICSDGSAASMADNIISENPGTYDITESVTLQDPKCVGYIFGGWYSDEACSEETAGIKEGSFGDKTFYAKWEAVRVTGITLNKTTASLMPGDSLLLAAAVTPDDAVNKSLIWASSNENIATVSDYGRVTAAAAGEAVITATAADGSGKYAECKVTVTNKAVTKVTLNKTRTDLYIGTKQTLTAAVTPADATIDQYEWKVTDKDGNTASNIITTTVSGNSCIIEPSENNPETGATATVTVTVTGKDGTSKEASCKVTIAREAVTISGLPADKDASGNNIMYIGKSYALTATVNPAGSTSKVTWESDTTVVAEVDPDSGKVTPLTEGTATITAETNRGGKAEAKITVRQGTVAGITLNKKSLSLNLNSDSTAKLTATIKPSYLSSIVGVTWTAADITDTENAAESGSDEGDSGAGTTSGVVSIVENADGSVTVTAKKAGSAVVTATAADGSENPASAACTVTVHEYKLTADPDDDTIDISGNDAAKARKLYVTDLFKKDDDGEGTPVPNSSITWSSSNEGVATVKAAGKNDNYAAVTAAGTGSATIRAAISNGPTLTYNLSVVNTIAPTDIAFMVNSMPADISGNEPLVTLAQDEKKTVKAYVKPSDTTLVNDVKWEADSSSLITVTAGVSGNNVYAATISGNDISGGTAKVTVTLMGDGGKELLQRVLNVCIEDRAAEPEKEPDPIQVITNVYPTVEDFPLSEKCAGWAWYTEAKKMKLDSFVGAQEKEFAAVYGSYTCPVSLLLTKLTKVSVSGNNLSPVMYYDKDGGSSNNISLSPAWTMNGNQLGDEEVLGLLKYAGMQESDITWTSSKPAVATVDTSGSKPTLTLKGAGTTTIQLTVKVPNASKPTKPTTFTAKYSITVVNTGKASFEIKWPDDIKEASADSSTETGSTESRTVTYCRDADGKGVKDSNTKTLTVTLMNATSLTAASSNTGVAAVKSAGKNGTYTLTLTIKAAGTTKLTLKANDKYKTTEEILLNVKDPYPVLSASSVTVNPKKTSGAVITIFPNDGYEVKDAIFVDNDITKKGDDSTKFTIERKENGQGNEWEINAVNEDAVKNGTTYSSLALRVTVYDEEAADNTYTYDLKFSVKVKAANPSYSVKQTQKVNLFYRGDDKDGEGGSGRGDGLLTITTDEAIDNVEFEGSDYEITEVAGSENKQFTLSLNEDSYELTKNRGKVKKGTLRITFEGYEDSSATVEKSFTVSTTTKKEKLTADKKSVTFYPTYGIENAAVSVLLNGAALTGDALENLELTQKNGASIYEGGDEYGYDYTEDGDRFLITYDGADKNKDAKISYQEEGWFEPLTVAISLKQSTKKPAVKLSKSTLTLNVNDGTIGYDQALSTITWKDGGEFLPDGITISAANNDAKTALRNGCLGFDIDDGTGEITAKLLNNNKLDNKDWISPNKSKNLKFKVAVEASEDYTVTTTLTVKVLNKAPSVTASVKGSINVLNREYSYATVTPKLNNINGTIEPEDGYGTIKLIGESAHLFKAVLDEETGKILVSLSDTKNVIANYQYKIGLSLNIKNEDGEVITLTTKVDALKIKLTQTKPALKAAAASNVIYSGVYNGIDLTFTAVNKDGTPVKIENVELLNYTDLFTADIDGGDGSDGSRVVNVGLNRNGPAAKGKSYTLKFAYTLKGQADNVSVYTVTQKVTVK